MPLRDPFCPLDFFALSEPEQELCFASPANAKQASSRMPRIYWQTNEVQAIHGHSCAFCTSNKGSYTWKRTNEPCWKPLHFLFNHMSFKPGPVANFSHLFATGAYWSFLFGMHFTNYNTLAGFRGRPILLSLSLAFAREIVASCRESFTTSILLFAELSDIDCPTTYHTSGSVSAQIRLLVWNNFQQAAPI